MGQNSRSDTQQSAEKDMIRELSKTLGRTFAAEEIPVGNAKVCVDGVERAPNSIALAESWAHVGKIKPAQRHKVRADMLKLALLRSYFQRQFPNLSVKSYLVFADKTPKNGLFGNSWTARAAEEFDIEPMVVKLPREVINRIKEDQIKQHSACPGE